jgi:ribosomal protein S18 acetylase RimI-like enzyme
MILNKAELTIRPYQSQDEEAVIDLWQECGLVVPQNDPHIDIARKIEYQPELFFVGTLEQKVIATIMIGYEGHRGWINYMAVMPCYQHMGFGAKLIDYAVSALKPLGCQKINLQVRETNKEVIEFYKKHGFQDDHVISLGKRLAIDKPYHTGGKYER